MVILAIETSSVCGSVAIVQTNTGDFRTLAFNEWRRGQSHAEIVTPAIDDAIRLIGGLEKISAVAVDVGPGSFTGIRVGINSANTLAWARGIPVIPFWSTAILIEHWRASGLYDPKKTIPLAAINAHTGMSYCAWEAEMLPLALSASGFADRFQEAIRPEHQSIALLGDGRDLLQASLKNVVNAIKDHPLKSRVYDPKLQIVEVDGVFDYPLATTLARMAIHKLQSYIAVSPNSSLVEDFHWKKVQPLYIRGSGAEEKLG